jgi:transposase
MLGPDFERSVQDANLLMKHPGVGPVVALTYRATIDVPARFKNSKAVGAVIGLTPSNVKLAFDATKDI